MPALLPKFLLELLLASNGKPPSVTLVQEAALEAPKLCDGWLGLELSWVGVVTQAGEIRDECVDLRAILSHRPRPALLTPPLLYALATLTIACTCCTLTIMSHKIMFIQKNNKNENILNICGKITGADWESNPDPLKTQNGATALPH